MFSSDWLQHSTQVWQLQCSQRQCASVCFCVHLCSRRLVSRWRCSRSANVTHTVWWHSGHSVVIPECCQTCLSGFCRGENTRVRFKVIKISASPLCFHSRCSVISPVNLQTGLWCQTVTDKTSRSSTERGETTPRGVFMRDYAISKSEQIRGLEL